MFKEKLSLEIQKKVPTRGSKKDSHTTFKKGSGFRLQIKKRFSLEVQKKVLTRGSKKGSHLRLKKGCHTRLKKDSPTRHKKGFQSKFNRSSKKARKKFLIKKPLQFYDSFVVEKKLQPVKKILKQLHDTQINNPQH